MAQLSFFDTSQVHTVAELNTVTWPDHLATVASQIPRTLKLGTMSWTYPGWIGVLYAAEVRPAQLLHRGLTAYAKHPLFRTVELDRSYYEPLSSETYARFAAQVPEDFRFVAKAHEFCTQVRFPLQARYGARAGQRNALLLDEGYATDQVVGPFVEGLGSKAGPLVFQFSRFEVRSPARFADRLHDFLRRLPKVPSTRSSSETRSSSPRPTGARSPMRVPCIATTRGSACRAFWTSVRCCPTPRAGCWWRAG